MHNKVFQILTEKGNNVEFNIDKTKDESIYACQFTSVKVNGVLTTNDARASICMYTKNPGCLYLNFKDNDNHDVSLCICDVNLEKQHRKTSVEKYNEFVKKNREIADWIHENIQNADFFAPIYRFTTSHWANMED